MGHYKSNLRDIEFNLFEVLGRDKLYGTGPFGEMDVDTAKSILEEIARLAENELADSFADADRNPPVFDPATNTAPVPESFKSSYKAFMDSEYWRLGLPEEIGGTVSPRSLIWAYAELLLGSNPAIWMYSSGPAFAGILFAEGNEAQKKVAEIAVDKRWGSTMVLTEPDAGSDVGAGRTKAVQQDDGSWHIEGVKRFITSGEHDMEENILHYVLARPEGHGPGTKGLSLFLVPKFHFDWETGELGERNGVYATNVEHKMGLKASNTCEMTFGDQHPAKGWLIGDKHDGIRQMFMIIEFARMMVGTKAIATLSTGYLNALEYAKERVQGSDLSQFMDKTAPKVTITHHPDVRRSLMTQKAYAEGMRSLVLYTASIQDAIQVKEAAGEDAKALIGLNDLLLPIVKGYGSEKSYEKLSAESLQTFGGSGYLQEYPIEQYIRDAKIDTLYEGTTAIQGQDFFFRKIVRDQGASLNALSEEIKKFLAEQNGNEALGGALDSLATAAVDLEAIVGTMITDLTATGEDVKNIYKVGLNTTRLLMASGDVVVGYLLLKGAAVAAEKLSSASAKDVPFYTGKIAAAKFFAANVLPGVGTARALAEAVDGSLMDLDEAAF
ncbi:acyl-CoA dehydrogenase [Streptomyces violascens]|uniref:Acyl-CoA dehydrogenase n=1 Tax=Streptomyces violascens TaxID=67381 RepID=A0ABQ3QMW7_9ACTN|nr:acyl-CoA dehydrogenase [Streptomyces violascens]GGU30923.1 acyl-CoA dehydrogenase [Streptomyces violascens]GHI38606.1 acyl-CoA dehydrogenase [Streptomyces violascens]